MIFITWPVYLGGGGTLIFPKPSAHFSSTYSSLGTESVILRNPRNIKSLPPCNPQFPVSPAKCPGCSLCPWRGSTEVEVGRQGRRSAAKSPVFLHEEQGDGDIQRMPPTTNTRRFPGCLYTYCRQTNKKGIQTFPLCFTEHFNTNTNISQRLSQGEKKIVSFVYDLNIKLQIRLHLCTSIAKVFPAQEAEKLTLSRCFHTTLSAIHRERPLRRWQNTW